MAAVRSARTTRGIIGDLQIPYEYMAHIRRMSTPRRSGTNVARLFQANIIPPQDSPIKSIVIEAANRPMPSQSMAFNLSRNVCSELVLGMRRNRTINT